MPESRTDPPGAAEVLRDHDRPRCEQRSRGQGASCARTTTRARGPDATEGWRTRCDGACKQLRNFAAEIQDNSPGFWIQSKVPDERSVNQAAPKPGESSGRRRVITRSEAEG